MTHFSLKSMVSNLCQKSAVGLASAAWLVLAGGTTLLSTAVLAEANRVTFPDLDKLIHYSTVRRGNAVEHMLTTREAIDAAKKGQPIPNGTHFVLVDHRDGKLSRYFVMQKGAGWGQDYDARRRSDDWQFQWFLTDQKSINPSENTARCQSCHAPRRDTEFLFTFDELRDFDPARPPSK